MLATHSLRCSQGARAVTRPAQLHLLSRGRLQSTAAAPVAPQRAIKPKESSKSRDKPTVESKRIANKTRFGLRELNKELEALYSQQRRLANTLKGPLHVRTSLGFMPPAAYNSEITFEKKNISLCGKRIPNIWLRDNCQCSSCMHESTKQRLQDTFAIPADLSIESAAYITEVGASKPVISIEWSDGHKSTYEQSLLAKAIADPNARSVVRQGFVRPELWTSDIGKPPAVEYDTAVREKMSPVLQELRKYGFCYIDNTPHDTPQATEELLRRIAFIRETHYGGFYDFTADLASQDTAYTNIALEAHTDNTYFSDPAGLQAFHLLSHTDGSGGASLLVDGFKVADELQRADSEAYRILSTVNVHAHASGNEGISIQPYRGFPVLEHDPSTGDLLRVRWNSSDRAGIELPIDEVESWYDAARKFDALLKTKRNEYWEQLVPGRVLVFDNWRVLHGRSAFTGKRRICGGYVNRDDWMSRFKMARFGQERVLGALPGS